MRRYRYTDDAHQANGNKWGVHNQASSLNSILGHYPPLRQPHPGDSCDALVIQLVNLQSSCLVHLRAPVHGFICSMSANPSSLGTAVSHHRPFAVKMPFAPLSRRFVKTTERSLLFCYGASLFLHMGTSLNSWTV